MWPTHIRRFVSDSLIFSAKECGPQLFDKLRRKGIPISPRFPRLDNMGIKTFQLRDMDAILEPFPMPQMGQFFSTPCSTSQDLDKLLPGIPNVEVTSTLTPDRDPDLGYELEEMRLPTGSPDVTEAPILAIKRTFQPSTVRKKRQHGFLVRIRSRVGRKIVQRRRNKGRSRLSL